MPETVLKSGWDTFPVAAPFLGFLLAAIFRVDELIASPNRGRRRARPPCGVGEDGEPLLSDPDGRLWRTPREG
ncbi:MAG: hypothetical protein ACRD3N_08705 [Terracidiphilus sp.]